MKIKKIAVCLIAAGVVACSSGGSCPSKPAPAAPYVPQGSVHLIVNEDKSLEYPFNRSTSTPIQIKVKNAGDANSTELTFEVFGRIFEEGLLSISSNACTTNVLNPGEECTFQLVHSSAISSNDDDKTGIVLIKDTNGQVIATFNIVISGGVISLIRTYHTDESYYNSLTRGPRYTVLSFKNTSNSAAAKVTDIQNMVVGAELVTDINLYLGHRKCDINMVLESETSNTAVNNECVFLFKAKNDLNIGTQSGNLTITTEGINPQPGDNSLNKSISYDVGSTKQVATAGFFDVDNIKDQFDLAQTAQVNSGLTGYGPVVDDGSGIMYAVALYDGHNWKLVTQVDYSISPGNNVALTLDMANNLYIYQPVESKVQTYSGVKQASLMFDGALQVPYYNYPFSGLSFSESNTPVAAFRTNKNVTFEGIAPTSGGVNDIDIYDKSLNQTARITRVELTPGVSAGLYLDLVKTTKPSNSLYVFPIISMNGTPLSGGIMNSLDSLTNLWSTISGTQPNYSTVAFNTVNGKRYTIADYNGALIDLDTNAQIAIIPGYGGGGRLGIDNNNGDLIVSSRATSDVNGSLVGVEDNSSTLIGIYGVARISNLNTNPPTVTEIIPQQQVFSAANGMLIYTSVVIVKN